MLPTIIELSLPEYGIDTPPDFEAIGKKIDAALEEAFPGKEVALRAISLAEHPGKTLDELVGIIVEKGTDRYDPQRLPVDNELFSQYGTELHASASTIGKDHYGEGADFVRKFYENILLDRGYRLRIDLILVYDLHQLVRADRLDPNSPGVPARLEPYLFRFRYPDRKPEALAGILKLIG
jgi:hypothetical protein